MKKVIYYLLLFILANFHTALAKDMGAIGQVYPITETDLLVLMKQKAQQMVDSGEWEKLQQQKAEELKQYIERPTPVAGLSVATETRSWLYDPAVTIPQDITDNHGRLIFKAGTKVNTLEKFPWTKALIFYDGDNTQEVNWVKQQIADFKDQVKLILVNGSTSEQRKQMQQRIYFDQGGKLVERLKIQHIPALVKQEGNQLKVTEVKL